MPKRTPLVLHHLESVSGLVLEQYPALIRKMIGKQAGIYALYRRNRLYYVGLASNLMGRLKTHLVDHHQGRWDRFSVYLTAHAEHIKELESLLLRVVAPRGNKIKGKFANSEDLKHDLKMGMVYAAHKKHAQMLGGEDAERRTKSILKGRKGGIALAGVFDVRTTVKGARNGQKYRATVRLDGTIKCGKKIHDTPSAAATAATGKPTNGWAFWRYRNKAGTWVRLWELRK